MLKQTIYLSLVLFIFQLGKSQNTFPNSGNAGINDQNPDYYLTIEEKEQQNNEKLKLLSIGEFFSSSNQRKLNFWANPFYQSVVFNLRSDSGVEFFHTLSNANATRITLNNHSGDEVFKVAYASDFSNTVAENFIHMPKDNSRIVIGNFGDYLMNQNYKLVVSNGDALIEGNANIDGYLTIGTNSFNDSNLNEDFKLSINGFMRAKKIRVYPDWADYVFKEGYDLMSLRELDKFIKANNHLPNIPSEKEVLKNGINIGEMNKKLLAKIEELTLHIIDMNKKMKELKIKIDKLEKDKTK